LSPLTEQPDTLHIQTDSCCTPPLRKFLLDNVGITLNSCSNTMDLRQVVPEDVHRPPWGCLLRFDHVSFLHLPRHVQSLSFAPVCRGGFLHNELVSLPTPQSRRWHTGSLCPKATFATSSIHLSWCTHLMAPTIVVRIKTVIESGALITEPTHWVAHKQCPYTITASYVFPRGPAAATSHCCRGDVSTARRV